MIESSVQQWVDHAREATFELVEAYGYDGWSASEEAEVVEGEVRGGLIAIVGEEVLLQVALLTDQGTARALAAGMLQMDESELDEELVADSLCELANVMAGSLKSRAAGDGRVLRLGLPVHVAGRVDPPPGATHVRLGHRWRGRPVSILLIERASGH